METDIKNEIKKTEEIAEGMATEVRSTGERVASLGESANQSLRLDFLFSFQIWASTQANIGDHRN